MPRRLSPVHLVWLALALPFSAAAQEAQGVSPTTRLIPYSAALPDAGPAATARAKTITFALYDEWEGGTRLWSETQAVTVDARGRYSAHLGAVNALPLDIFRSEQARWLEVTVDGRALARTMLVAVPYALRAADAETLGGKPLSDFVLSDGNGRHARADGTTIDDPAVDGTGVPNQLAKWNGATTLSSSIITESFDNRIGILAPDPTGGGVVDSRFTIRHLDGNTALGILNIANQRRFALNIDSLGGWSMYDGAGGSWRQGIRQRNGHVGIGTLVAQEMILAVALPFGPGRAFAAFGNDGTGIFVSATGTEPAGEFLGDVDVSGTLTKGGGAFRIDHPLDPANKYLQHSFVESPEMMNVYNGNATLDGNGEAWVTLPDWFEALNRDFRYQLTSIGGPATPYIASKISDNRFKVAGGVPNREVSWQVTGIRQDAWANANRIPVEKHKPAGERGFYLHPKAFDLPASLLIPSLRIDPSLQPIDDRSFHQEKIR